MRRSPTAVGALLIAWSAGVGGVSAQSITFAPVGTLPIQADTLELQDGLAYVAAGKTLAVFDVKDPATPKKLGAHSFPEEIWAFRLHGRVAYLGVNFHGLAILDLSNPSSPVVKGTFKTPGQAKTAAVFENKALVIDHMEGVVQVDITNPSTMTSPGSFFVDGYARDVATAGSLAFAVDSPTGLYVFDLARPGPLEPISTLQNGTALRAVEVSSGAGGRLAVLVGGGALQAYDVSDPAKPVRLPAFKTPGGAQRVALQGRLAYVADGPAGLQIVDLSKADAPAIVGSHKTATPARDVAVSDSLVLVAVANDDVVMLRQNRK